MSLNTASAAPAIDPTKHAEYPIILGDKLAGKDVDLSTFVNITYNHKSKSATANQRTKITRSSVSQDLYNLTITDKAGNAEQTTLEYKYKGSVDPSLPVQGSDTRNLVLVFDPVRKAFVLESVGTSLNFNLRSAPGKNREVIDQYEQLHTLDDGLDHASRDESDDENPGKADQDNPYDFRHFLPKADAENDAKPAASTMTTPDPHGAVSSRADTPLVKPAKVAKPAKVDKTNLKPLPKPRQQNASSQQRPKQAPKSTPTSTAPTTTATKKQPKSAERVEPEDLSSESAPPSDYDDDDGRGEPQMESNKASASPNSNLIYDGDLIIDMGSPPSRPTFRVNPAHFSSNNSSANEADGDEDEEEFEDLRLPSPARQGHAEIPSAPVPPVDTHKGGEDEDDEDALAAEMEAAFEEEASRTQNIQQTQRYVSSEDESEVSEEE